MINRPETDAGEHPGDEEFLALMGQIRAGSEDAAWQLVERYGAAVRRTVRRVLNKRLRARFDSLDFVQLVWSSLFRNPQRLDRFQRPDDLAAFLVVMAQNKVGIEVRRQLGTQKRDLSRELPITAAVLGRGSDMEGHEPDPAEVAVAREQWQRMMHDAPEHYRRVVELRLQGRTLQQIAGSLGLAVSTVHGILNKLSGKIT